MLVVTASPERADPAGERLDRDRGQRDQHDHAQVERGHAEPEAAASRGAREPRRRRVTGAAPSARMTQLEAVGTPAACSILVIDPEDGSKNFFFTFVQPPR